MKIFIWLCIFLSIPFLALAAVKQPNNISVIKEFAKTFSTIGITFGALSLLRFPGKRYLLSKHSKQHRLLRNSAQLILRHHTFFSITACILLLGHGILFFLATPHWTMRLTLGCLAFFLFVTTSVFGYLINKKTTQKYLFYNLHLTCLLFALSITLLHIKYRTFSWLFK